MALNPGKVRSRARHNHGAGNRHLLDLSSSLFLASNESDWQRTHFIMHISTPRITLDSLAVELVEKIAWHLRLPELQAFRTLHSKCAAAGFKPLLEWMPCTVNLSTITVSRKDLGRSRRMSQLKDMAAVPAVARIIYSLSVGQNPRFLDLLPTLHLPTLSHFRLDHIHILSSHDIESFLTNHGQSLRSVAFRNVNLSCLSLPEGLERGLLPERWRSIFITIRELPRLTSLVLSELGYEHVSGANNYRL